MENQRKELSKNTAPVECAHEAESLSPEVAQVIKELQPEQRKVIIKAFKQEAFSGPIPHPELLQKYENIQGGFADRIIKLAEKQLDHRIDSERQVVDGSVSDSKRGQIFAFIVAVLFLVAAVYLGINGHDWLAGILGGGTLVSLVTVFVTGKKNKD